MAKARARAIQESIRQVLLHDWDPLGVADEPSAQDEYDSYVGGVYRLLLSEASAQDIADHLWEIENDVMGILRPDPTVLEPVAEKLLGLDIRLNERG